MVAAHLGITQYCALGVASGNRVDGGFFVEIGKIFVIFEAGDFSAFTGPAVASVSV